VPFASLYLEVSLKKRQLGSCVTFFPQATTLIGSRDSEGVANLMMASWVSVVSKTPPTLAVSLNYGRKSYENIRHNGVFSVNVVTSELIVAADACGLASGRDLDKTALPGLQTVAGSVTDAPLVERSTLNVECRRSGEVELGDYRLVLGEIVEVYACEQAYDKEGGADIQTFDPLVYLGGLREYWSLGAKQADAYRSGLTLLPDKQA
jgi:flavin reductase (DIM6/NTAB) family NADH-FMN oxidoreductase RutF